MRTQAERRLHAMMTIFTATGIAAFLAIAVRFTKHAREWAGTEAHR